MDGLEISEVKLNQVNKIITFRIDSEYFQKKYVEQEIFMASNKERFSNFNTLSVSVNASAFYPALEPYYGEGEIPFIRVADVKNDINYNNCTRIPIMGENFKTLKMCKEGDIVLTKGGTIGNVGLIKSNSYVTRDLIFIDSSRLSKKDYVSLFFILKSNFTYNLMVRSSSLSVQPHLTITLIKDLPIYLLSCNVKDTLLFLYEEAYKSKNSSESIYTDAEETLLEYLGFIDYVDVTDNVETIKLGKSFFDSGRLDSDYYLPKYTQIEQSLNTPETVNSLCKVNDESFTPVICEKYKYIELSNIGSNGEIVDVDEFDGSDLPTRARRLVKKGQVIVSSVEGSLGSCALIDEEYDNALCSTGFYVVDSESINSETLLVMFKSSPIQALLKKRCSGTILTAINKDEFLSMPLPLIEGKTQVAIKEKIQESFALRKKSVELLEFAKTAVEIAIEQGEEESLKYLKEKGVEV